jgi:hypothetical protein
MKNNKRRKAQKTSDTWMFMRIFRKTGWIVCVGLMLLCSCSSSKNPYKKRRKPAPCDCPKFNHAPQNDSDYKVYVFANL